MNPVTPPPQTYLTHLNPSLQKACQLGSIHAPASAHLPQQCASQLPVRNTSAQCQVVVQDGQLFRVWLLLGLGPEKVQRSVPRALGLKQHRTADSMYDDTALNHPQHCRLERLPRSKRLSHRHHHQTKKKNRGKQFFKQG